MAGCWWSAATARPRHRRRCRRCRPRSTTGTPPSPSCARIAQRLDRGELDGIPVDPARLAAPLPRAYEWVDGSAFLNHVILVRKARNAEPPKTLETDPLIYQGGSGDLLGCRDAIVLREPAWGLDFESEVAVVLGDIPIGTKASGAERACGS